MTTPEIRPPRPEDEQPWRTLWSAYNRFYRARIEESVTAALWADFFKATPPIACLLACKNGTPIGLAHFLLHSSTWSRSPSCYLEDLFVAPEARGQGAARALITAVAEAAKARGADMLYWHTQEFNADARALYDTLAQRTSFIVYRRELGR